MTNVERIGYIEQELRWRATIVYQVTHSETRTVVHDIEELGELQDLIEQDATFCSIVDFKIKYMGSHTTIKESME